VIIGAGFGGLYATQALSRAPVDVTVIDRTNHHLFQPLLYQVATGVLSEGDIAPPTRDILRRQQNAKVPLGEVLHIVLPLAGWSSRWRPDTRISSSTVSSLLLARRSRTSVTTVRGLRAGDEDDR
jgi:2-polyprenyl-6-methoxyphenol hydroxylase-like FAD-dependent oxidoreductase